MGYYNNRPKTNIERIRDAAEEIASGGGVLVATDTEGTLDKTWKEIYDATFCVIVTIDETGPAKIIQPVTAVYLEDGEYTLEAGQSTSYIADAEDGYPATA